MAATPPVARHPFGVLPRLIARTSTPTEKLLLALAAIFAAANGVGFPLLPLLFARTVAQFSALYNPDLRTGPPPTAVDAARITRDVQRVSTWMLLFGLAAALSTFILAYIQIKTARVISGRIRRDYFKALMRQDAVWYNSAKVGDLSTRVTAIDTIERAMGETAIDVVRDIFAVGTGFLLAFTSSWKMTLIIFAFMPVIAGFGILVSILTNRETRACQSALGQASATVHETFSLIRAVLAFGGQDTETAKYGTALDELYKRQIRRAASTAFGTGFLMLVLMCTFCVGFLFGNRLVRTGEVTLANAIAASAVVPSVFAAFRLANEQKRIAEAAAAAQSVFEVMNRDPVIDPLDEDGIVLHDFKGGIRFENVRFHYAAEDDSSTPENVLDKFNLDMQPGTSHGLCGPSGSGKSTIVNLIERFYDVCEGQILLDGEIDIRQVNVRWLRSQIGLVGQTPTLFQGTVQKNIEMGIAIEAVEQNDSASVAYERRKVSLDEVIAAAKIANAHDFITALPDGYDTQLGEGGALLSGGQKQRVCIARAIVRNPKILLLDESTASLDNKSEAVVQQALERAAHNRTTLIVAHRTGTIRRCDRISVLKEGNLVESDTHDNLMKIENGAYATMVSLQNTTAQQSERSLSNGTAHSVIGMNGVSSASINEMSVVDIDDPAAEDPPVISLPGGEEMLSPNVAVEKGLGFRVVSLHKKEHLFTAFGVFGSAVVGAAWPLAAATICELLLVPTDARQTYNTRLWSLLLFGCGLGAFFGILIQNIFLTISGERLTRRVRERAFRAMLAQDMSFFDRKENGVGSLVVKLNSQVSLLKELSCDTFGSFAVAAVSIITGVTIAMYYCWRVALSALVFMPGVLLSGYSIFRVGLDYSNPQVIESVRVAAEALHCNRTVASFGMEYDFMKRYNKLISAQTSTRFFDVMIPAIMSAYIAASPFCLFGTAFWTGSAFLRDGTCNLLGVNKATLCLFLGSVLVGELSHVVPNRQRAKLAASEYFRLMALEEEALILRSGTSASLAGNVDLEKVEFAYPNRGDVQVLRGLSASVEAGKTLALVGSSGSGKSTVIGLIQRFYGNRLGSILADEHDVCDYDIRALRSQIGLVHQEPEIFNRTIGENIAYGLPHTDGTPIVESAIHEAARIADAHDFITSFPDGYNTIAGPNGSRLSGGQQQRIAIARAIVRKPAVLLLDEATSSLDSNTEQTVQKALDAAASERTTIVVAHRLATIRNADCIAVVDRGTIVEQGTHEELVKNGGMYAELCKAQTR